MKIVVSGLTAAGKTTLCEFLSESLSLPLFSASTVLRERLGSTSDYWTPALDEGRTDLNIERSIDEAMVEKFESEEFGVFDAWGLAWFSKEPAIRIWLESDSASRALKCQVSWLVREQPRTALDCARLIKSKDDLTRRIFQRNWGFDLFTDRSPFNLVLDVSRGITAPTFESSAQGIEWMTNFVAEYVRRSTPGSERVEHRQEA